MPLWKRLTRLALIITLTPVLFLLGCQSKLIYHPRPYDSHAARALAARQGHRLEFTTSQGSQVAFYVPPRAGDAATAPLWLCFAGNGSLALDWLRQIDDWDPRQAFLLVDYPGYGDCAGTPNPRTIRDNATAAVEALARHLGTPREALVARSCFLGHSLGGAAALMAADDLGLTRGVLISTFTTMTDMGRLVVGWPLCLLNRHGFDNQHTLARVAARPGASIVIFHGTNDEVIPTRMGRELARAHPGAVVFHKVPGAQHNTIFHFIAAELAREMTRLSAR